MKKNLEKTSKKKPILLCVMDGWGHSSNNFKNAVKEAKTPNFDNYIEKYPSTLLKASGEDVGLPNGQVGNSEVGHINIGAGRVVKQYLMRIDEAINNKKLNNHYLIEKFSTSLIKSNIGGAAFNNLQVDYANNTFKNESLDKTKVYKYRVSSTGNVEYSIIPKLSNPAIDLSVEDNLSSTNKIAHDWDWYENKSYIRSYIDPVNTNSNLVFCIENNFVEIKFKCPKIGYGTYDLQIIECLKLTCDKVKTLSI